MLTREQIAAFKRDGTLVLENFAPESQLDTWRSTFWKALRADPNDPETWPGDWEYYAPNPTPSQKGIPGLSLSHYPPMVEIADQLMGAGAWRRGLRPPNPKFGETPRWKEDDLVQATWPDPDRAEKEWTPPGGGHVDGGNTNKGGWKGGFMLGAILMLEDVEPNGGCFYYWPRSHLAVHSFMKSKPEHINPNSFPHPFGGGTEALNREAPSGYTEQPRQWAAKAGTCILWHHWIMHNGSMNTNDFPRLGLFARWYHKDYATMRYDKGGIRSDGDLWKYWSEELRSVPWQQEQAPVTEARL